MFETSSTKYDWINRIVAMATVPPDGPISVFSRFFDSLRSRSSSEEEACAVAKAKGRRC